MLLRYFKSYVVDTLRDRRLMVSKVRDFNDPFEVMYCPTGTMNRETARAYVSTARFLVASATYNQRQNPRLDWKSALRLAKATRSTCAKNLLRTFESIKKSSIEDREKMLDRVLRVGCFTDGEKVNLLDEILMWSIYAEKHTGFRVGFEFPAGIKNPFYLKKVSYSDVRIKLDLTLLATDRSAFEETLMESTKAKSSAWGHEREHRLFTHPKFCIREPLPSGNSIDFVRIDPMWIRRIDFGARCPLAERDGVVALIRGDLAHIKLYQAKYHPTDYALEYEPIGEGVSAV
jgi:hypothetical protein